MLDGGKRPKLFTFKEALQAHINHASAVLRRDYLAQLEKLKIREEIINGLLHAYSILDNVIQTIKDSNGRTDAIYLLTSTYDFTQRQAEAIVDLRLHRLSKIDITKLQGELDENHQFQNRYDQSLNNQDIFNEDLIQHYTYVIKKYGDVRKTVIYEGNEYESANDGDKPEEPFWMTISPESYLADYLDTHQTEDTGFVDPDMELYIITSQLRGFKLRGSDVKLGEHPWSEIIKLNPGEVVRQVVDEDWLKQISTIVYHIGKEQKKIDKSFLIVRASKRGRKLLDGKILNVDLITLS